MDQVCRKFVIWYDNKEFQQYLSDVASLISSYETQPVKMPSIFPLCNQEHAPRGRQFICTDDLLGPLPDFDMKSPLSCRMLESHSLNERPAP